MRSFLLLGILLSSYLQLVIGDEDAGVDVMNGIAGVEFQTKDLWSANIKNWATWKETHDKQYHGPAEEVLRMGIFLQKEEEINRHNQLAQRGEKSFFLKHNSMSDKTDYEIKQTRKGFKMPQDALKYKKKLGITHLSSANIKLPDEVDWRKAGAVTEVKNQGSCGSCWTFSATGALEGQNFRKTGKLVSLSEQQLIDCDYEKHDSGCDGGMMESAFTYVKHAGGINYESKYPYEMKNYTCIHVKYNRACLNGDRKRCRFDPKDIGVKSKGFVDIPLIPNFNDLCTPAGCYGYRISEEPLREAVAKIGPISVAMNFNDPKLISYSHGIYDVDDCNESNLDHGLLVVGYGSADGKEFWIVKNSWGEEWGENGYIRFARNKGNMCGIASHPSYPLV